MDYCNSTILLIDESTADFTASFSLYQSYSFLPPIGSSIRNGHIIIIQLYGLILLHCAFNDSTVEVKRVDLLLLLVLSYVHLRGAT
jgi:hypothetical protein